jgi:transcriptional regulator with XRE-family HTH domain
MTPDALLREARAAAGLTQAEVARRMGTTQPVVARLERPGANPRYATLERALRATGHRLDAAAARHDPGIDETLIHQQLAIPPDERLQYIERQNATIRELFLVAARQRGELA